MNYAVIKVGAKQYRVSEGQTLVIEKIAGKQKEKISFDEVLLLKQKEKLFVGSPLVKKAQVKAEIINQFKDKKIRVVKFKAKSRYRRTQGHRQLKTRVKILKISTPK